MGDRAFSRDGDCCCSCRRCSARCCIVVRGAAEYGGGARLGLSVLGEMLISRAARADTDAVPLRSSYVGAFAGWAIHWQSPTREDAETTWREALRRHGAHTLLGIALGRWRVLAQSVVPLVAVAYRRCAGCFRYRFPVYSSRLRLGRRLRAARLFLIPEETRPPAEIRAR